MSAVPFCYGTPHRAKALKPKDYAEHPATLAEHLLKRRKELRLLQREAAARIGCHHETYRNWEKARTEPPAFEFKRVIDFLGYDPAPTPVSLADKLEAKRRRLGVTLIQVARTLGWDEGTLRGYLRKADAIPADRRAALDQFLNRPEREIVG